jgi:myo-inositol-1(or 4)-monophosphatase
MFIPARSNFAHGHDHVATSIALSLDRQIALWVVQAPFHSQIFHATSGGGTFHNGIRIIVSSVPDSARALIAIGFPQARTNIDRILDRLKPVMKVFGDVRRLAAPVIDVFWVADGRLDGFVDRVRIWEIVAAGLIASEAGARTAVLNGNQEEDDGGDI